MADNLKNSPAVQSMEKEQAQQREKGHKGDLEIALEDTFPASDPVSQTGGSIPTGRADTVEAERRGSESSIASGPAPKSTSGYVEDLRRFVRARPITAIAIAGALGWTWGVTR